MSLEALQKDAEHSVHLISRKELKIVGVLRLVNFDESYVVMSTSQGDVEISGQTLQVDAFEPDSGVVLISGDICGINYLDDLPKKKKRLWN